MGEFTDKVKGNVNEAIGKAKQKSDDPETRAEGREDEAKGKAQQAKGEAEGKVGNDI
ncbi:MAG: CsbD family protein [Erythrobacter sp.]|uniref:CsbD family protein n=1 Tax=Erythrobacter sp. TaxID=1042 RepID=UPI0032EFD95E